MALSWRTSNILGLFDHAETYVILCVTDVMMDNMLMKNDGIAKRPDITRVPQSNGKYAC